MLTSKHEARLHYYNRQQKLIRAINTYGSHLIDRWNYWDTELEYLIILYTAKVKDVSFVEVFEQDKFLLRRFYRDGVLSPCISTESDRVKCPWIREKQISTTPLLDWSRILKSKPPHESVGSTVNESVLTRLEAEVVFGERGSEVKKFMYNNLKTK